MDDQSDEQPSPKSRQPPPTPDSINILFVCSKNKWRSPTGESIYRQHPFVRTRSAGTSAKARHRVSQADIEWADIIFVMETKHRQRLRADSPAVTPDLEIHVLGIEDIYQFMDPELIDEIKDAVDPILATRH